MRKNLIIFFIFSSFSLLGQEKPIVIKKNELKLNLAYSIVGFPEITFERILRKNQGLGFSYAFSPENFSLIDYIFIPYYRFYFGEKVASGFFIEGNCAFFVDRFNDDFTITSENEYGLGIGAAVGYKILTKRNRIVEFYLGGGPNFLEVDKSTEVYPRLGITIGKRF